MPARSLKAEILPDGRVAKLTASVSFPDPSWTPSVWTFVTLLPTTVVMPLTVKSRLFAPSRLSAIVLFPE